MIGVIAVGMGVRGHAGYSVHENTAYFIAASLLLLPSAIAYLSLLGGLSGRRNYWAASTCLLNLLLALPLLYVAHLQGISPISLSGLYLALNVAGIWLFLQRDAPRKAQPQNTRTVGSRTSPITDALFTLLSIAGSWALWGLWERSSRPGSSPNTHFPWDLLVLAAAVLILTAVHESGHALVAAIFRMKLLSFTVGACSWQRIEGRWRFRLVLPFLGGAVSLVRIAENPDWQEIVMLSAGPAANLVTAPLFFWASLRIRHTSHDYLLFFFGCLAVISFACAIFNLFPMRVGKPRLLRRSTDPSNPYP